MPFYRVEFEDKSFQIIQTNRNLIHKEDIRKQKLISPFNIKGITKVELLERSKTGNIFLPSRELPTGIKEMEKGK